MSTWATRIKSRMHELGMTQEALADKMGITRGAVTHYLSGRRVPPLKQFQKLAMVLKVDPAWLQYGTDSLPVTEESSKGKVTPEQMHHQIPLLTWDQAVYPKKALKSKASVEFIAHFYTDQPDWFALKVKGDAMIAPLGNNKNFYEEEIIVIDPNKTIEHGHYVIALLPNSKEATFKQYIVDGGIKYLKPLNPQYPIVEISKNITILGVVVARTTYF